MYQALYRKYRPSTFGQVIGQEHIVATLKNEIKNSRVAHAYLFTGTRGTGKTSCAKIFAKAVNCLDSINGEPCNKCSNCRGIDSGSILDVIEIDAASNNGVDNIREIRDEVAYTPSIAKKKVYIIDEVHMLSIGAFNALLKTLEEPPSHVIFILATTEVQKIAPTILSRCQRFDFKRILSKEIFNGLKNICKNEKISADDDALTLVSKIADGSMRDALSILERCIISGEHLDKDMINSTIGLASDDYLFSFIECFNNKEIGPVLNLFSDVYSQGKDISLLCDQLLGLYRDIMVYKSGEDGKKLISESQNNIDGIEKIYKKLSYGEILNAIEIISEAINKLSRGVNKKIIFEMCLFKLCIKELQQEQTIIEPRKKVLDIRKPEIIKEKEIEIEAKQTDETVPKEQITDNLNTENNVENNAKFNQWGRVLSVIKERSDMSLWASLKMSAGYLNDNNFKIVCPDDFTAMVVNTPEQKKQIKDAIKSIIGRDVSVEVVSGNVEVTYNEKKEKISVDKSHNFNEFVDLVKDFENIKIID